MINELNRMVCTMVATILSLALVVSCIALLASLVDMLRREDSSPAVVISGAALVLVMIVSFLYIVVELVRWYL